MKAKRVRNLAENVNDLLTSGRVGHLSTITPKGRTSIVPIGYYFDGKDIYFGTPKDSAKLKFIQNNPNVSFTIDNGKVMREALGILIQGQAEIYDAKETFKKFKKTLPAIVRFSIKYPDVFAFYTKDMKMLPEDRKFYKYRLIRIVTEKALYWDGYNWGRMIPRSKDYEPFFEINEEEDPNIVAKTVKRFFGVLRSTEIEQGKHVRMITKAMSIQEPDIVGPNDTISKLLEHAIKDGKVTPEEKDLLLTIRTNYRTYQDALKEAMSDGFITKEEFSLLEIIKRSVYQSALSTAMKDGVITEDEHGMLDTLKEILRLN